MKKIILGCTLLFITLNICAQRSLDSTDISKNNAVFGGRGNEACVTISASNKIVPIFYENNKKKAPAKIDTVGTDVNYHLVFDASPGREKREINIKVDGYLPLTMNWFLHPKQQLNFVIFDRDSILDTRYNQWMREGDAFFISGMYVDARKKYASIEDSYLELSKENGIDEKIALIDSIIDWRNEAEMYFFDKKDYTSAIEYYQKVCDHNSQDKYAAAQITEARIKGRNRCISTFTDAEDYFVRKKYAEAKELYERVISWSCGNAGEAAKRLREIANKDTSKRAVVLVYEYAFVKAISNKSPNKTFQSVPIGLSVGKYKDRKAGGYFSLRFNTEWFKLFRNEPDETVRPEASVSFGWTIKVVKPVWLFFGPGYTGVGRFVHDDIYDPNKANFKLYSAISPEIGLLGKIKLSEKVGLALRYTFQYRIAIKKDTKDYIGNTGHAFGLGFCF